MTEQEQYDAFIEAIIQSVREHGRASTEKQGAERAYAAIKKAGLLKDTNG